MRAGVQCQRVDTGRGGWDRVGGLGRRWTYSVDALGRHGEKRAGFPVECLFGLEKLLAKLFTLRSCTAGLLCEDRNGVFKQMATQSDFLPHQTSGDVSSILHFGF